MNIDEIRKRYPQYDHLSDEELEERLGKKALKNNALIPYKAGQLQSTQSAIQENTKLPFAPRQQSAKPEFASMPSLGPLGAIFPTWGTDKLAKEMKNWLSIMESYHQIQSGEYTHQYSMRNIDIAQAIHEAAQENKFMLTKAATEAGMTPETYINLIVKQKTAEVDMTLKQAESDMRIREEEKKAESEIRVDFQKKIHTIMFGIEKDALLFTKMRQLAEQIATLQQEREQLNRSAHSLQQRQYRLEQINTEISNLEAHLNALRQRPVPDSVRRKPR